MGIVLLHWYFDQKYFDWDDANVKGIKIGYSMASLAFKI
jgi:hypothetical protein